MDGGFERSHGEEPPERPGVDRLCVVSVASSQFVLEVGQDAAGGGCECAAAWGEDEASLPAAGRVFY